jgi:uncharacterized transporter YbjL
MNASERLRELKAAPRERGEARFFFHDTHFASDAVKVLPGEYFVAAEPLLITTTLGSCIAVCLWDRVCAELAGSTTSCCPTVAAATPAAATAASRWSC